MKKKKPAIFICLLIIIILSLVPLRSLSHSGMFISHDGEIHLARLANFEMSFKEGNRFPRWGANLNNGYGHPTLMFLYPLPNYLGLLIRSLNFSYIDSIKILFALGYVFSGIFMFLLLINFFKPIAALGGSVIYLYAPYRFVDLYVRGALPEHLFFTLLPLGLLCLIKYYMTLKQRYLIITSLLFAFLILVHNASAFIFFPILLILIFLYFSDKIINLKTLFLYILPFILGIILSFYYWYPAIIEGKYTLRHLIINKQFTMSHLVKISKLIIPNWGYGDPRYNNGLSVQIGLVNLLFIVLFTVLVLLKKIKINRLLGFLIAVFLTSIFLMTDYSRFIWQSNNIMFNIHFPWRFLVLIIFIMSFISSLVLQKLLAQKKIVYKLFIIGFLIVFSIGLTLNYHKPIGYFEKNDEYFFNGYSGTGDNGESSPIWSTLETVKGNYIPLEIIEGDAQITNFTKKAQKHIFHIKVLSDRARIVDNTLYFPGWTLYDNNNSITDIIEFQDPNYRGLMTFWLESGDHKIILQFRDTKVRKVARLVSLTGLLLLLIPIQRLKAKKLIDPAKIKL